MDHEMGMEAGSVIIDAWMQHPSAEFLEDPLFDSLRRWAHGRLADGEIPAETTVAAMDAAGVRTGMLCAWWGPRGPLISNDAVAAMVRGYPGRFTGVAAVDLARPMDAVRELRRCVRDLGFRALRVIPWLWNLPPSAGPDSVRQPADRTRFSETGPVSMRQDKTGQV